LNRTPVSTDVGPVPFGRYIKAIREQKGIDLETVSGALKVSTRQLSLIEAEDHDELPDEVYVKGLLRAYADYIGIDPEDLIDRYRINRAASSPRPPSPGFYRKREKRALTRMFFFLFLLAAISGAAIAVFYKYEAVLEPPEAADRPPALKGPAYREALPARAAEGKLVLVMDAVEKTWIRINIDGEESLEYLLRPKDHVELEADSHYIMRIGNAGGLKMRLNGRPVHIPGKSGEVVSLKLPQPSDARERNPDAE
jgi:transcriptional regulator with XRE-family HTH domain